MCGKDTDLSTVLVEGVEMEACQACARFGKAIKKPQPDKFVPGFRKKHLPRQQQPEQGIVSGYGALIRNKREKMGIKQVDLARMLSEKESIIQKIENNQFEPSIALAKKLEKYLKITLIEEITDMPKVELATKSSGVTIGDMIKIRKKN